jgi:hypothetical protein
MEDRPCSSDKEDSDQLSARQVLETLSSLTLQIQTLTEDVENAVLASICSCAGEDVDAIENLQKLDVLRQSVGDARGLINLVAPRVEWLPGQSVRSSELREAVDMLQSLSDAHNAASTGEIVLL